MAQALVVDPVPAVLPLPAAILQRKLVDQVKAKEAAVAEAGHQEAELKPFSAPA